MCYDELNRSIRAKQIFTFACTVTTQFRYLEAQNGCNWCLRSGVRSGCHTSMISPSHSMSPWFFNWCSKELSKTTGLDEDTRGLREVGGMGSREGVRGK